ncbi:glycoside hydrolase family 92 protein [Flagellimonas nanhaiensis]|uniref:Glycoside hydrolase family 92 protein n=2 Tax=Flagellimonas nanhaiensis TaxID=2292706 RepID=A0A371JVY9_9FLAO|nr:GH92 family glycosyl hydrolase [Allomuricauda nanhaiensis]RDY61988.1 glycoside hydrolase family 92 protein [Allomuricauda nanhaiensis]
MTTMALTLLVLCFSCKKEQPKDTAERVLSYVDPFIGTGGHGHTFPGAVAPFGMVQPSPDNGRGGWDWCSGYHITDSLITGFAQLHLSGTGIGDLADLLLMPTAKAVDLELFGKSRDSLPYVSQFTHDDEVASPGYYSVLLKDSNIKVELTANEYVALHKYTYPTGVEPSFIMDLGYAVNWDKPLESHITLENEKLVVGYRHSTGWAKNQKLFFAIESSEPLSIKRFVADSKEATESNDISGVKTGAQFFIDPNTSVVELKIAVSSVSIENAKENLNAKGKGTFEETRTKTEKKWESVLSKIKVETPVDSLKTIFYTALYHTHVAPSLFSDVNGEFRLQNDSIARISKGHVYSTLSLWDTFRAENPLLNILQPEVSNDVVLSMLAYYDEQGRLPVWTLYGNETNTMTGNHGVSVLVDSYLKGLSDYDAEKAYEAAKETMMRDERGLAPYKEFGYIPFDKLDESVTISLEFAYNDWCIAQMAKALGKDEDYNYFLERSKAYQYLFDKNTGFMRGKSSDGDNWRTPFDPKYSNHREHTDYTEGNAWQHSWFVLHDVQDFINLHGGNEPFAQKLEQLFTESSEITGENTSADISGLIGQYAHGNEPSHHIAYMFNKADMPGKTQYWVREILDTQYSVQPDGLSGNEDCGQMSAWYVFSSIGLYPMNPASGQYEFGSPIFEKTTISLDADKSFVITAPNTSSINKYIQSVKLNGKQLDRTYITHKELMNGGTLEFEMGSDPQ